MLLSLDEAILHCQERAAEDCSECAREHLQLAGWLKELKKYKVLEKQGKLLKLPCAVGNEVFFIFMDCPKDYKEEYCKDHEGSCENCNHRVPEIMSRDFRMSDIPNMDKFFATREEAEAALKMN